MELLVAMTLAAIVLGAASSTLVRQRRSSDAQLSGARAESQLRAALGELQGALADLAPSAGDLVAGQARDTALQLRAIVGNAVACDSTVGQTFLVASDTSDSRSGGFAVAPRVGDTLWWHPPGASGWTARRVADISAASGTCAGVGAQPLLRVAFNSPDTVPKGAPLRLTRQTRYSFYHAGDGSWQLGISDWSDVLHAFAPPQPVAGPFTLVAPGGTRTGFRYFDAGGATLSDKGQGIDVASVARVRVTIVTAAGSGGVPAALARRDSLDIAFGHGP